MLERGTGDLSWSPDGSTVRFTRDKKIWEVSSNGSNPHQLLPGWRPSASQWGGQWTLDGEFFLFVSGSIGTEDFRTTTGAANSGQLTNDAEGCARRLPSQFN